MAQTLLQRLLGIAPPSEPAKAETGSGWISMATLPHLNSLSNRPEKLIAEAEALFHSNVWVAACERAIVGRFASVEYHLETAEDESLEEGESALGDSLLAVLNRPSARRSRRQLWSITARHMGLTGNAFWYLDKRSLLGGTPLECLYINPARMTPAENSSGELLGWIMDHPQNPLTPRGVEATPFELSEIIHFVLDEPDWGNYGIGIAETAQAKVELSRLTDRHAAITVASGGRLAGIISPKAGAEISEEGWAAVVRDYRNIVSDPDAAKRLQIIRRPIDFTETSADPTELQLVELSKLGRDDILGAWNVPPSQLGITITRGQNSGETQNYEEAAMWQGPIDYRLRPFAEKVQTELIDRWAELGLKATLVLETPEFDDEAPLYENATKAVTVPLTVNQRLELVGKDPLDEAVYGALGNAIFLDSTMVRIDDTLVPITTPENTGPPPVETEQVAQVEAVKASPLATLRHRVEMTWEPRIRKTILRVLEEQRSEVAARIEAKHAHLVRRPTDTAVFWNSAKERARLTDALEPLVLAMAREVANRASDKFPAKAMDAGYLESLAAFIRKRVGERITDISETTRSEISRLVQAGVESGLGPVELAVSIRDATAFNEARAELISRTETMFAYNDAALRTYSELGATTVQAIDGDQDDECAARDGREFSVDEAYAITDHPNGTLDWIPVVPAKAAEPDTSPALLQALKAAIAYGERPEPVIPAPIVNVEPVVVPAPQVMVDLQPLSAQFAELKALLTPKPRKVTVLRDERGQITGTVEE